MNCHAQQETIFHHLGGGRPLTALVYKLQGLGVLGKHRPEDARDNVTIIPNGADQTRRYRIEAGADS